MTKLKNITAAAALVELKGRIESAARAKKFADPAFAEMERLTRAAAERGYIEAQTGKHQHGALVRLDGREFKSADGRKFIEAETGIELTGSAIGLLRDRVRKTRFRKKLWVRGKTGRVRGEFENHPY